MTKYLLIITLIFSLQACGKKKNKTTSTATTPIQETPTTPPVVTTKYEGNFYQVWYNVWNDLVYYNLDIKGNKFKHTVALFPYGNMNIGYTHRNEGTITRISSDKYTINYTYRTCSSFMSQTIKLTGDTQYQIFYEILDTTNNSYIYISNYFVSSNSTYLNSIFLPQIGSIKEDKSCQIVFGPLGYVSY